METQESLISAYSLLCRLIETGYTTDSDMSDATWKTLMRARSYVADTLYAKQ